MELRVEFAAVKEWVSFSYKVRCGQCLPVECWQKECVIGYCILAEHIGQAPPSFSWFILYFLILVKLNIECR